MRAHSDSYSDRTAIGSISRLLQGSDSALENNRDQLAPLLYEELRRIAQQRMLLQSPSHTLQATALVHEVWMKIEAGKARFETREHFLRLASRAMRQILVDHSRGKNREKRGGLAERLPLEALAIQVEERAIDLEGLNKTLERLREFDPQMANAVDYRFFGGASVEETAQLLGMSKPSFERRWSLTRAWLASQLEKEER